MLAFTAAAADAVAGVRATGALVAIGAPSAGLAGNASNSGSFVCNCLSSRCGALLWWWSKRDDCVWSLPPPCEQFSVSFFIAES